MTDTLTDWLVDSGPALAWPVARDLLQAPEEVWQKTLSRVATTWSLNSLREWGLDASVLSGTAKLLAANSRWEYDNLPYWGGEVNACINSYTLANGAWLGADVSGYSTGSPASRWKMAAGTVNGSRARCVPGSTQPPTR